MRRSLADMGLAQDGRAFEKREQYLAISERARLHDAQAPVRLLDIGVQIGGPLERWSECPVSRHGPPWCPPTHPARHRCCGRIWRRSAHSAAMRAPSARPKSVLRTSAGGPLAN
jgi:hypothetical protein